ncbi:uncharacterized protein LOC118199323 [Stegodyphus dumicola]|uniref:uncharacterized protein LOC118199323 n=1 Tax=Stegodyphus dumicola TaxID=202533 RepID=UPI0015A8F508|nr:uncharacterized protein LOC118199323 [Stegodyphus dumicola]
MAYTFVDISVILISLILVSASYAFYLIYYKKCGLYSNSKNAFVVFDVIKMLKKICPVGTMNEWQLFPLKYGMHRCWRKQVLSTPMRNSIDLCGSCVVLNCSTMSVANVVQRFGKLMPVGNNGSFDWCDIIIDVQENSDWVVVRRCSSSIKISSGSLVFLSKKKSKRPMDPVLYHGWVLGAAMHNTADLAKL